MFKFYILSSILFLVVFCSCGPSEIGTKKEIPIEKENEIKLKSLADTLFLGHDEFDELVRYGYQLIVNTPIYIGPNGKVGKYAGNLMSCTNCHLDAGTRKYGLSLHASYGNYPQYRSRENKVLDIKARINNCVERPLNGDPISEESKEMLAIVSYLKWLGEGIPLGETPKGTKLPEIELLKRAANPKKGAVIYKKHCASCHGENGEGKLTEDEKKFLYPSLWGNNSYQKGSSMYRLTKMTAFVYANMPNDKASAENPFLSLEEAYDVSAFVNDLSIHERPGPNGRNLDYKNLGTKPFDYPHGPYLDPYSEKQHRFGPYQKIIDFYENYEPKN